ncbi:AraC family transcriptional regulator [Aeromicrobium fastidiosum]|uniref:helix-turn-helix transcriptional regulator n=1 Tax=Aeromicrobium fastidiosum TaxID=52699 RepID=UPI0020237F91|nr:AraC family transcriptional regulator [Aeromicrobium fastidiosum]MCL8253240.1 AraC family transcriptional regulator [Aeromicrobium fastidiosum]
MTSDERVRAWRPDVPGVGEVLHAHFTEHAYPAHTHDLWTVLLVDTGGVSYELERRPLDAPAGSVTLLPPHVPHDGRAVSPTGFDKRVIYLDERWLPLGLTGAAVAGPTLDDGELVRSVAALHGALARPGDELEAETRLAMVSERMVAHLDRSAGVPRDGREPGLARRVRDLLDRDLVEAPTLESLADDLDTHATHLVRAFGREYGLPPHRYVTGRRVDRARRLLLDGMPAAEVATTVGFHDQAHLIRHFRRTLGVTPGAYVRSAA